MGIRVYTDASSNLFKKILENKNLDITVLPMTVELEDDRYLCYEDNIDAEVVSSEFYKKMEAGARPKTSLMSPGLFQQCVEDELDNGNEVIYISLSSGISGSYQSACLIANDINEEQGKTVVRVIDSKTAGFGEGMIAIRAYELVKEGKSLDEVFEITNQYVDTVRSEFTVNSITYLAQTGRVNKILATIANVLAIKPLLYGDPTGKIEVTQKVRGRKIALKTLAEQVDQHIADKSRKVFISHCNALEDAEKLKELLEAKGIHDIEIYFYDLVTGAHVGPGTIAVFYEGFERRIKKNSIISNLLHKKEE